MKALIFLTSSIGLRNIVTENTLSSKGRECLGSSSCQPVNQALTNKIKDEIKDCV